MIPLIYILLLFASLSYQKKKHGYIANVYFFVSVIWIVCGITAYYNPVGLIPVSNIVHIYSFVFIVSFNLSNYKSIRSYNTELMYENVGEDTLKCIWKRTKILCLIAITAYSSILVQGLLAFFSGDYAVVKSLFYQEGVSYLFMYFVKVIPIGMIRCLTVSSLYFYFYGGGRKFLALSILLMLLTTLSSMTRVDMIVFIVAYFYLASLNYKRKKINLKPLVFGIALMSVVSVFFRGNDFLESLIVYLSGSFSFFQYILDHPFDYDLNHLQYGYMTFASITEPVMLILKVLGFTTAKTPEYLFNINCQEFVNISYYDVYYYNNNTTALYMFIYDFGPIGILIGGILLGLLTRKLYVEFTKKNLWLSIIYLYVVVGLFTTTMSYNRFFGLMPLTVVITSYFLTRGIKN